MVHSIWHFFCPQGPNALLLPEDVAHVRSHECQVLQDRIRGPEALAGLLPKTNKVLLYEIVLSIRARTKDRLQMTWTDGNGWERFC